jgi:hypothetical protein
MNNWKTVSQIAFAFGITFIIFAILAAIINYEINTLEYTNAPTWFFQVNALSAMLVFLLLAVLSFIAAWITKRSAEKETSQETPSATPKPQDETKTEKTKQ